ncbi:MAG: hypothetical protein ACOC6H_04795, partial [Thermoproteota archaeon]
LTPFLRSINPALIGIVGFGLIKIILIAAIPLFFGLLWNRWAGGISGFLLGSIYALSESHKYLVINVFGGDQGSFGGFGGGFGGGDLILLGYLVSAMLMGYMAGALNKSSNYFLRMLVSSLIAAVTGGLLLFLTHQFDPLNVVTGPFGFLVTVGSRIALAIIVPILAKIFMWFDITPKQVNSTH